MLLSPYEGGGLGHERGIAGLPVFAYPGRAVMEKIQGAGYDKDS
jgi:hypothetical protein